MLIPVSPCRSPGSRKHTCLLGLHLLITRSIKVTSRPAEALLTLDSWLRYVTPAIRGTALHFSRVGCNVWVQQCITVIALQFSVTQ